MSARPAVDVGVVTWNTAELTVRALRRMLDTDQGCDVRLLVRDNGSTDGTADAIAENVPEAELDAGEENVGFAAGVNTLIARSHAPWLLLLNSDAWPEEGAIGRLVEAASANARAAVVVPRIERPDGVLEHSTHAFPSVGIAFRMAFTRRRLAPELADELMLEGGWAHDRPREVDWAVGAAWLMRREAIADVGGFDERFFMYVEDLEWCWRARRRGWQIWFEPGAVVRHVGNASGARRYGNRRTAAYMANTYSFYRSQHGVIPAMAYRGLNIAGAGLRYLEARRSRDRDAAAYWRTQLSAHIPRAPERRRARAGEPG